MFQLFSPQKPTVLHSQDISVEDYIFFYPLEQDNTIVREYLKPVPFMLSFLI